MFSFYLLLGMLVAGISFFLAKERGRNPLAWGICGFLFGIFGVVFLLCLPRKNKEVIQKQLSPRKVAPTSKSINWFYVDKMKPIGPVNLSEMQKRATEGMLSEKSLVWCDKLSEWTKIEDFTNKDIILEASTKKP